MHEFACRSELSPARTCSRRVAGFLLTALVWMLMASGARGHIGSPDTFVQAEIGPYHVLIAAHPPAVTPGAMELDLRFNPDDQIHGVQAWLGDAAPTPVTVVTDGTASASLWSATADAQSLHITLLGVHGAGAYDVKLPPGANAAVEAPARRALPVVLLLLAVLLVAAAAVLLTPGRRSSGSFCLLAAAAAFAAFLAVHGARRRTTVSASLSPQGRLDFTLSNPGESFADLVPDHGKLLHLFLVREPQMDVLLHLHPQQLAPGRFTEQLPAMPPGTYELFADFYHGGADPTAARGETATLRLTLPAQSRPVAGDPEDSFAVLSPLSRPQPAPVPEGGLDSYMDRLPDGYSLQLVAPTTLRPLHANLLQVRLRDPAGEPPSDMALYLGMTAHAVVLRADDGVFAHIHPGGTLPMLMPAVTMMPGMAVPASMATIPYGFPTPGIYRIFVQMKHGHIVETGAFNLTVD